MTLKIRIWGHVQGVFFRQSAKSEAKALGLAGWVKNHKDGSVEALIQGDKKSVDKFLAWCRAGPPMARVEKVEVEESEKEQDLDSFGVI